MNAEVDTEVETVYLVRKRVEPGKQQFYYWLSLSDGQLASWPSKSKKAAVAIAVGSNLKIAAFCSLNYFESHYLKQAA